MVSNKIQCVKGKHVTTTCIEKVHLEERMPIEQLNQSIDSLESADLLERQTCGITFIASSQPAATHPAAASQPSQA